MSPATPRFRIIEFAEIDSTNSEVRRQFEAGSRERLCVIAGLQTAGRGRESRQWLSEPGNLYTSLLLPLSCSPRNVAQLSLVVALAVHDTLAPWIGRDRLQLKWPNDCLADGRKVSGILIEGISLAPLTAVAGIGINVRHAPQVHGRATACVAEFADSVTTGMVHRALLENFVSWETRWNGGTAFEDIRKSWMERAGTPGDRLQVKDGQRILDGRYAGLGADGELLLQSPDGETRHIYAGDVEFGAESIA